MTGLPVPVGTLNLIRAVLGIHHHRFDLFVKCSSKNPLSRRLNYAPGKARESREWWLALRARVRSENA
jgi:hypothetical protein